MPSGSAKSIDIIRFYVHHASVWSRDGLPAEKVWCSSKEHNQSNRTVTLQTVSKEKEAPSFWANYCVVWIEKRKKKRFVRWSVCQLLLASHLKGDISLSSRQCCTTDCLFFVTSEWYSDWAHHTRLFCIPLCIIEIELVDFFWLQLTHL